MFAIKKTTLCIFLLAGSLVWCFPAMAEACPNCKGTLDANNHAMGYAISILFMMGMPFAILSGWGVVIWRLRTKQESPQAPNTQSNRDR